MVRELWDPKSVHNPYRLYDDTIRFLYFLSVIGHKSNLRLILIEKNGHEFDVRISRVFLLSMRLLIIRIDFLTNDAAHYFVTVQPFSR